MSEQNLLIFRREFLPVSETFIVDHIESLKRWRPWVASERLIDSPHSASHQPLVVGSNPISSTALRRWGVSGALDRLEADKRIGLIHCHFLTDAAVIIRHARKRGLPLVITAHGNDATTTDAHLAGFDLGRLYLARRQEIIEGATKIVCVSQFILDELVSKGFPPEKLYHLPLGIDLSRFQAVTRPTRRGAVAVGRMVEKKGQRYLIEAWAKMPPALAAEGLTLVGDGPLRAELEALAAKLGAKVTFEGARPRDFVIDKIASARAFVFPSVRASSGDSEGMPIVLMEAQALGTPAVVFDIEPMAGGVAPNESALLAKHKDVDDLALVLTRLMSDSDLAKRLGEGGRKVAAERYDLALNTARLEDLYDQVALKPR